MQKKLYTKIPGTAKRIFCFWLTLGALVVLLLLSARIPNIRIQENLLASANYLLQHEDLFHQIKPGDRRTEIHNYADATTLNILYSANGKTALWNSIMSPFYSDRVNLDKSMTELLAERIEWEWSADTLYDRYWHGMIMIIKPLLLLFTLQQIRWILLGSLFVCLGILTILLVRQKQYLLTGLLWLGAFSVQAWMAGLCIEYYPVFLITFLISIAMVLKEEKREQITNLCIVSGVCVAFFDFLTTETLAFVIPLACVYSIWSSKGTLRSIKEELVYFIKTGISWVGAYAATYLTKWILASFVYGEERISVALSQLADRQGNAAVSFAADSISQNSISPEVLQNAGGEVLPQFLSAVVINIRLLLGLSGKISLEKLALGLVLIGLIVASVIYLFRKPGPMGVFPVILLLLGTIPVLRMMVLHNHSLEHCFFVYRSLYGTIVCFGAGLISMLNWNFLRRRKKHGSTGTKKQR